MSAEYDHQICPSCGGEFTLAVTRCAECDVDLVPPGADPDDFPPASELVCVRVAALPWIEALSTALEEREVLHRIEPVEPEAAPDGGTLAGKPGELLGLYVAEESLAIAREIDDAIAARARPAEQATPLAEGEVEPCPACGEELAADVAECPECGLVFGG